MGEEEIGDIVCLHLGSNTPRFEKVKSFCEVEDPTAQRLQRYIAHLVPHNGQTVFQKLIVDLLQLL